MRTILGDRWADIQETAPKKFPVQQSLSRGRSSRRQLKRAKMASWRLDWRKACIPRSGDELLSAIHWRGWRIGVGVSLMEGVGWKNLTWPPQGNMWPFDPLGLFPT